MRYVLSKIAAILKDEGIADNERIAEKIEKAIRPLVIGEMPCSEGDLLCAISEVGKIVPAICVGVNKNRWGELEVMYREIYTKGGTQKQSEILYSPLGEYVYLTREDAIKGLQELDNSIDKALKH